MPGSFKCAPFFRAQAIAIERTTNALALRLARTKPDPPILPLSDLKPTSLAHRIGPALNRSIDARSDRYIALNRAF